MQENKLSLSLIISCAFHLALVIFMSSLFPTAKTPLKTPVWVDVVDIQGEPVVQSDLKNKQPKLKELQASNLFNETFQENALGEGPLLSEQMIPLAPFDQTNLLSNRKLTPYNHSLMEMEPLYPASEYMDGDTSGVSKSRLFEKYFLALREEVEKNWAVASYADLRDGTAIVQLTISADGSLAALELSQSSGMAVHDDEAIEAVKKTAPFHPPPKELIIKEKSIVIRFSFHYFFTP